ncbi:FAD-dependent oxidoreductase [Pseudonocardia xinjiangensis]|uniref:FAD-dependent oxidoreductase n=1 Tax=Pseudonocardia xinjiangensis TaxID=75289 RepID=UPI003D8B4A38
MSIDRPRRPAGVFADLVSTTTSTAPRQVLGRAVVMGGSVAGLLAARVLADVAAEVVIVERDGPDPGVDDRPGVPHGLQVHALLAGGRLHLDRWFPGFSADCVAAGAFVAPSRDLRPALTGRHRWLRSVDPGVMSGSRPFLEGMIRRRVLALPAVTVVTGRATGLECRGGAVTGVHVEAGGEQRLERADLVVDATGRASRLGEWLERAGWDRPDLLRLPIELSYATGYFRRTETPEPPMWLIRDLPGRTNGGVYGPIEDDRYIVMISAYGDHRPGSTIEDFRAQLRADLPEPFTVVSAGEPQGPIRTYHMADSRRRDFGPPHRLPARLVAVGDAVASFNPTFGQGISSAALHAVCLESYLSDGPDLDAPADGFFARQRVVVDAAWRLSTIMDVRRTGVVLPLSLRERLARRLTGHVLSAGARDAAVEAAVTAAGFMLVHPDALLTPAVLARAAVVHGRVAVARGVVAARHGLRWLAGRVNERRGRRPLPVEAA